MTYEESTKEFQAVMEMMRSVKWRPVLGFREIFTGKNVPDMDSFLRFVDAVLLSHHTLWIKYKELLKEHRTLKVQYEELLKWDPSDCVLQSPNAGDDGLNLGGQGALSSAEGSDLR